MSYPIITRLGISQFWYKHWYTGKFKNPSLQQDVLIQRLLQNFLVYGMKFDNDIFVHEYWMGHLMKSKRKTPELRSFNKLYSRFSFTHEFLQIEHSFNLRLETPEFFPMRIWILRYKRWLIVSVKWFKPHKVRNTKSSPRAKRISQLGGFRVSRSRNTIKDRLKMILLLTQKSVVNKNYIF